MCRGSGWVEERVAGPDIQHVVNAEVGVLEQVGGLPVDLERILIVKQVDVEPFHMNILTNTNDYTFRIGSQGDRL